MTEIIIILAVAEIFLVRYLHYACNEFWNKDKKPVLSIWGEK